MKPRRGRLLMGVFLSLLLSACNAATPTPVVNSKPQSTVASNVGYPAPGIPSGEEGYPGPLMFQMQPAGAPPVPPAESPQPVSGRAAISGVFYSRSNSQVIPGTLFYLRPGVGADGREPPAIIGDPDTQRGDVVGQTDQNGQFMLNAVPPGNYYIFIWAPYAWRPVEVSADNQNLRLIELKPDQSTPLGVLYVAWP